MLYYGFVDKAKEINSVFGVLRNALKEMPQEYPFRGPKEYCEMEYTYSNTWSGDINGFNGKEIITLNDYQIYRADYVGGHVDKHNGI